MKIKEIEISNYRIYRGYNSIDLLPDSPTKNMIIISGKNGYGKTTFLMSLVWCLYGKLMSKVDRLYADEIGEQGGSYPKYISNSINRLSKKQGENSFTVSVTFIDLDIPIEIPCKEIKVIRSFNTLTKDENLEILINGVANEITSKYGYEKFIHDFILPREIAKFFFFDAEKIASLAEIHGEKQRRDLSKAYSEVLGIKKYEDLRIQITDLLHKLKSESATAEERKKLIELKSTVEANEVSIAENLKKIDEIDESNIQIRHDLEQVNNKLLRQGNLITDEELEELQNDKQILENKAEELQKSLKNYYEIIPFGIAGDKLREVAEQILRENEFRNNKINYENIENKTNSIISELDEELGLARNDYLKSYKIDWDIRKFYNETIKSLIKKHFFPNNIELPLGFEIIHNFSDNEKAELESLITHLKMSFKEELKRISSEFNQTNYDLEILRRKISEAESHLQDEVIAEIRKERQSLNNKFEENIGKLKGLEIYNENLGNENKALRKEITKLSEHIKVSDEQVEKEKLYKKLINELNSFIINFQTEKKKSLESNILSSLKQMLHMDLVDTVKVEITMDYIDIMLFNKRGEEISKESLSKGQQQIYASALLKSLVEESEFNFPVFIDSPMQKFDETHSENIIKYFYPNVSEQVVIFPLLYKELTRKEYDIIKPSVSKAYYISNVNEDESKFQPVEIKQLMQ